MKNIVIDVYQTNINVNGSLLEIVFCENCLLFPDNPAFPYANHGLVSYRFILPMQFIC